MGLNAQGSKEHSAVLEMEILHELEISFKFEVGEDSGWRSWGTGCSGSLINFS